MKNTSISSYSLLSNSFILNNSVFHKYSVNSIWPIDRALSSDSIPGQSGPGSYDNEGVFLIPQTPNITETSSSYCLVSYQDTYWGGVYNPSRLGNVLFRFKLFKLFITGNDFILW